MLMESLESRRMFSVDPFTATLAGGVLTVQFNNYGKIGQIKIEKTTAPLVGSQIVIDETTSLTRPTGFRRTFAADAVGALRVNGTDYSNYLTLVRIDTKYVTIDLGGSYDYVDANTSLSAMRVDAGAGDDFMYCGSGDDVIYCGKGIDDCYAGGGNDLLYGQEDGDDLHGGYGSDTFVGGGGADEIYGYTIDAEIYGFTEPGIDVAYYEIDGPADHYYNVEVFYPVFSTTPVHPPVAPTLSELL